MEEREKTLHFNLEDLLNLKKQLENKNKSKFIFKNMEIWIKDIFRINIDEGSLIILDSYFGVRYNGVQDLGFEDKIFKEEDLKIILKNCSETINNGANMLLYFNYMNINFVVYSESNRTIF
jgi:hypothetical protein